MKWWSDLWLNEGFATFMEYYGTEAAEPRWDVLQQMHVEDGYAAYSYDSSFYTHSITNKNANLTVEEIEELFDSISYSKGSLLIRMLKGWVDSEAWNGYFFERIRFHLQKFKYSNADTHDLMDSIKTDVITGDVTEFMDKWSTLNGHPLVNVSIKQKDSDLYDITLSQRRFLQTTYDKSLHEKIVTKLNTNLFPVDENEHDFWPIPITIKCIYNGKISTLMMKGENITLKDQECDHILVNVEYNGFYRVAYPSNLYEKYRNMLMRNFTQLSSGERFGLINDILTFSQTTTDDIVSISDIFDIMKYIRKERDYVIWKVTLLQFESIRLKIDDDLSFLGKFDEFVRKLIAPLTNDMIKIVSRGQRISHLEELLISLTFTEGLRYQYKVNII
jgi:glutamyl aminopeptidase